MEINLLDILVLAGLSQGAIFGMILLFSKFFREKTNRYLGYSVIMLSVVGLNQWLSGWGFDDKYYFIDFFGDDVPWVLLFFVPMLIYFARSAGHPLVRSPYRFLLLLPFAVFLVLNLIINLDVDFHFYEIPRVEEFQALVYGLEDVLALLFSIGLCIWSWRIISGSDLEKRDRLWLRRIWFFIVLLVAFWTLLFLLPAPATRERPLLEYSLWIGVSCFIYWLTYKGLYQLKLLQDQSHIKHLLSEQQTVPVNKPVEPAPDGPGRNFTPDNPYFQQLQQMVREEHLYRDPELGRDTVAEKLGISTGYLSQLINAVTGENFATYINFYRVEDVKRMILDPDFGQYSLLAIGLEAGFKSKSAFYSSFKKVAGMTPNQFRKRYGGK